MKAKSKDIIMQNKAFVRLITGIIMILFIPLIAMQFTSEVNWNIGDFLVMFILLFVIGSSFILLARKFPKNRFVIAIVLFILLLYVWAELAVGLFTNLGS